MIRFWPARASDLALASQLFLYFLLHFSAKYINSIYKF